jgi:hypothetical protein
MPNKMNAATTSKTPRAKKTTSKTAGTGAREKETPLEVHLP